MPHEYSQQVKFIQQIDKKQCRGSGSFPFLINVFNQLIQLQIYKILTQNFSKHLNIKTEDDVPVGKL
jgi:hypothetical protein